MRLRDFIREHRKEIDKHILKQIPGYRLNDQERENWIRNDIVLYYWAKSQGMNIKAETKEVL